MHDADELEEVNAEEVGLGSVGLPELREIGAAEGCDSVAGFGGCYGPGGERGDFFETGWGEGRVF